MLDTAKFGLKHRPFVTLPTGESVQHWAGLPDAKQRLEDIIVSVRPDDIGEREFVLLYGAFGGGKTHALRFFQHQINDKEGEGYAFFVSKPKLSAKPTFLEVYRNTVSEHRDMLLYLTRQVRQAIGDEARKLTSGMAHAKEELLKQQVLHEFVPQPHRLLVSKMLESDHDDLVHWLMGKNAANDDYAATCMMASLIGVMTSPIGEQRAPYKAAYLFLDEMEGILGARPADSDGFFNALRELINQTAAYHCAVILAFTTEVVAILEGEIPEYLLDRMTRPFLELKELTSEDAKQFIKDYLRSVRINEGSPSNPYTPFSEEAIEFLLERHNSTPRDILKSMGRVFERATRGGKISPGEEISRQMAEDILNEMHV